MNALAHLYLPGALALWCALFFAIATLWGYGRLLIGNQLADRVFARRAYGFFALALLFASVVLLVLLLRRDFRIEYVYQYSGLDLPWFFQMSAFWAGQKGSFLIWLLFGALIGLPLRKAAGKQEATVMGIYTMAQLGLLLILVRESPFVMLAETPLDGTGLNPLLQDNWMVIHPPVMFVGYASTAIPFAFAISAMWRRQYDDWARLAFPWALGGFLVLGTAIMMGGYWAYKTLGWGGYWGWDPVENASLIPWLLGTVLIHGLYLERRRGRYRRANLVVACLGYMSVLYGTFLTRSGVLADFSVHSFVDLGISGWLIAIMAFFGLLSLGLLATRLKDVKTAPNEDPLLSRGSFLVLSTITVGICTVVVTVGTSAPLLTGFMENPGQVGPSFYNRVNLPIALLVAALLGIVPYLTWRDSRPAEVFRKMVPGMVAAGFITAGAAVVAVRDPFHLLYVFLAALALSTNVHRTVELARTKGLRLAGGYLSHVGVGVILLGFIASSAYDDSTKATLAQGIPTEVGDMTLTFTRFIPRDGHEKERMEVEVVKADGSSFLAYPKLFVNDRTRQVMANPDIRNSPLADFYISPIAFDPGREGDVRQLALSQGESASVGEITVTFAGFDMNAEGNAMQAMSQGGIVSIGATVAVERSGARETVVPIYRFSPNGAVETPPTQLGSGGTIRLEAIDATTGGVRLLVAGVGAGDEGEPARLSVDVTRKPLINLVWYGLYIILAGGGIASWQRWREARAVEEAKSSGDLAPST